MAKFDELYPDQPNTLTPCMTSSLRDQPCSSMVNRALAGTAVILPSGSI